MKQQDDIQKEFIKFHKANPSVYDTLVRYARELREAGYSRYSIKGLFEVLRFSQRVNSSSTKLSNNFTSRYARLIMSKEKDLAGFFQLRALTAGA